MTLQVGDTIHVEFDGVIADITSDHTLVDLAGEGTPPCWLDAEWVDYFTITKLVPEVVAGDVWLPAHMYMPFIGVGESDGGVRLYASAAARALPQHGFSPAEFFVRYPNARCIGRRSDYDPLDR
jgi:hypothetical protein